MRIAWATDMQAIGDGYGFTHGNRWGRRCLQLAGVTIDPAAPIAVHHCPPHSFKPIEGKRNVLWTAWEFPTLPDWELGTLDKADAVCVTGRFLVDVFKRYTKAPVFYAPQGIDTERFFPKHRHTTPKYSVKRPFHVLWLGAANDRKGWQFVLGAWRAFEGRGDMHLTLKTTQIKAHVDMGNITVDNRDLSGKELAKLYQSADCFAFPSMGEGFGFTLGEAMACAVPCLYTPCTSLVDMANPDVAIPVRHRMGETFKLLSPDHKAEVMVEAAEPDATDLALKILWVKENPAKALRMGRKAAGHIRKSFTWRMAGVKLRKVLEAVK